MPNSRSIGQRIKILRSAKGLSQQDLAEKVGTTTSAIGNYESGCRVPKDSIKTEIAKALDTSVEFIFFQK